MNDLKLNDLLVIDWPVDKPFPKFNEKFDAGIFGIAMAVETQERRGSYPTVDFRRVAFRVFQKIKEEEFK